MNVDYLAYLLSIQPAPIKYQSAIQPTNQPIGRASWKLPNKPNRQRQVWKPFFTHLLPFLGSMECKVAKSSLASTYLAFLLPQENPRLVRSLAPTERTDWAIYMKMLLSNCCALLISVRAWCWKHFANHFATDFGLGPNQRTTRRPGEKFCLWCSLWCGVHWFRALPSLRVPEKEKVCPSWVKKARNEGNICPVETCLEAVFQFANLLLLSARGVGMGV